MRRKAAAELPGGAKSFVLLLAALLAAGEGRAALLESSDGDVIVGEITDKTEKSYTILTNDSQTAVIPAMSIRRIDNPVAASPTLAVLRPAIGQYGIGAAVRSMGRTWWRTEPRLMLPAISF